jgi:hypothetical protein
MKKANFAVFLICFLSSFLQAQQNITIVIERKSETMPDWLLSAVSGDLETVNDIDRFKTKYIFYAESSSTFLEVALWKANKTIVASIGGSIRSVLGSHSSDDMHNIFEFNDEISAYEAFYDRRSQKIEEDYWIKERLPDGSIRYIFYKIIALERAVIDEIKERFIIDEIKNRMKNGLIIDRPSRFRRRDRHAS